jgi:hypothetical protein
MHATALSMGLTLSAVEWRNEGLSIRPVFVRSHTGRATRSAAAGGWNARPDVDAVQPTFHHCPSISHRMPRPLQPCQRPLPAVGLKFKVRLQTEHLICPPVTADHANSSLKLSSSVCISPRSTASRRRDRSNSNESWSHLNNLSSEMAPHALPSI